MTTTIDWNAQLEKLQSECFLVGPVTDLSGTQLPDGFDLAVTRVKLEVGADTYKVGASGYGEDRVEEHALSKSGIEKLATAAGAQCAVRRIDDRANPWRCEYEAQAVMRMLDGSQQFAAASRGYDLTEDGADYIEAAEKARNKLLNEQDWARQDVAAGKRSKRPVLEGPALDAALAAAERSAVMQARATMQRNGETKAKLRALRTLLGIRSKYPVNELKRKHFAVLRAHFSGRSADPALRQQFALMAAESALGASRALFVPSAGAAPMRALPSARVAEPMRELPRPVADDPPDEPAPEAVDTATGEVLPQGRPESAAAAPVSAEGTAGPAGGAQPAGAPAAAAKTYTVSDRYPVEALRGKAYTDPTLSVADLEAYVKWAADRLGTDGKAWSAKGKAAAQSAIDAAFEEIDYRNSHAKEGL